MERIKALVERYSVASSHDWAEWYDISTIRKLHKGECLIPEGKIAKVCAFVLKGSFKNVVAPNEDDERILNFGFETDFLASCESYNKQQPSAFSIIAMEDAEVLVTNNDELVKLCLKKSKDCNAWFQINTAIHAAA